MNYLGLLEEEVIAVDANPKLKLKSQHPKWDNRHGENQTSSADRHREVPYQNIVLGQHTPLYPPLAAIGLNKR